MIGILCIKIKVVSYSLDERIFGDGVSGNVCNHIHGQEDYCVLLYAPSSLLSPIDRGFVKDIGGLGRG